MVFQAHWGHRGSGTGHTRSHWAGPKEEGVTPGNVGYTVGAHREPHLGTQGTPGTQGHTGGSSWGHTGGFPHGVTRGYTGGVPMGSGPAPRAPHAPPPPAKTLARAPPGARHVTRPGGDSPAPLRQWRRALPGSNKRGGRRPIRAVGAWPARPMVLPATAPGPGRAPGGERRGRWGRCCRCPEVSAARSAAGSRGRLWGCVCEPRRPRGVGDERGQSWSEGVGAGS